MNKFAPKRTEQLITIIPEEVKPISIAASYYVGKTGNIYRDYEKGFYLLKNFINSANGYVYNTLIVDGKHKTFRNHRLVALAWIPNPDNFPIVGHKDNNKTNNSIDNLYWTTNQENVQKAVNDHLLVNDKGFDDSQSHPIACFDLHKNFIKFYGSAREAHRELGISVSTVSRQAKHEIKGTPRCGYYFRYKDEYEEYGFVL